MDKVKGRSQVKWIVCGTIPIILIALAYIALDIYSEDTSRYVRAAISLVSACVSILLSIVAIYKVRGWYKLFPVLSIVMGVLASSWFLFVMAFLNR